MTENAWGGVQGRVSAGYIFVSKVSRKDVVSGLGRGRNLSIINY